MVLAISLCHISDEKLRMHVLDMHIPQAFVYMHATHASSAFARGLDPLNLRS